MYYGCSGCKFYYNFHSHAVRENVDSKKGLLRRAVGCLDKLISTTPGRPATFKIYLVGIGPTDLCGGKTQ